MANQTRMERNQKLHDHVNREIAYKKQIQDEKSVINSTFEKLKEIDKQYFTTKLSEFDKKHEIEKPYLDRDRSNNLISEELKYEIRRHVSELDKIKVKEFVNNNKEDENIDTPLELNNEKYQRYYKMLIDNDNNFQKRIDSLKIKQTQKNSYSNDIPMATVQKVRSQDNRTTYQMLLEATDKLDKGQNKLMATYRNIERKSRFKWMAWFLPLLVTLMIAAIIVPIFVK